MKKQDLTMYSDRELSLFVLNEEPLYRLFMTSVRLERFNIILDHVEDIFIFTQEQENELRETWEAEFEEQNEEESRSSLQSEASQNSFYYHIVDGSIVFYNSDQSITGEVRRSNLSSIAIVNLDKGELTFEEEQYLIKLFSESGAQKR